MGINKIVYNGGTLIDLTGDTVTADKLAQGYTAHDKSGEVIIGTATGGGGAVIQDEDGGLHFLEDGVNAFSDAVTELANGGFLHTITGVMASGGGGESDIHLLTTDEIHVSTASTTVTLEKAYSVPLTDLGEKDALFIFAISDNAGHRNGYFYSSLSAIVNTTTVKNWTIRVTSDGSTGLSGVGYGVYVSSVGATYVDGVRTLNVNVSSRYSSTYSLTVDGTYSVSMYYIDLDSIM